MSLYDYECPSCGRVYEKLLNPIDRDAPFQCESCAIALVRQLPRAKGHTSAKSSNDIPHADQQSSEGNYPHKLGGIVIEHCGKGVVAGPGSNVQIDQLTVKQCNTAVSSSDAKVAIKDFEASECGTVIEHESSDVSVAHLKAAKCRTISRPMQK